MADAAIMMSVSNILRVKHLHQGTLVDCFCSINYMNKEILQMIPLDMQKNLNTIFSPSLLPDSFKCLWIWKHGEDAKKKNWSNLLDIIPIEGCLVQEKREMDGSECTFLFEIMNLQLEFRTKRPYEREIWIKRLQLDIMPMEESHAVALPVVEAPPAVEVPPVEEVPPRGIRRTESLLNMTPYCQDTNDFTTEKSNLKKWHSVRSLEKPKKSKNPFRRYFLRSNKQSVPEENDMEID